MPDRKTTKSRQHPQGPQVMGPGAVKDLVEQIVRDAARVQARELEKHLQDIDQRLTRLEKQKKK